MKLKSRLIILAVAVFCFSACDFASRNRNLQSETAQTDKPDSKLTVSHSVESAVRNGNKVSFKYTAIASKENLATISYVAADCRTFRYQTTYWAITQNGVPITENDEITEMKIAVGDMKNAIQKACAK